MKLTKLNPKSNFEQELKFKSVEKDGQGNWWWSVMESWTIQANVNQPDRYWLLYLLHCLPRKQLPLGIGVDAKKRFMQMSISNS